MRFVILRILTHSELGFFHEYRRQGLEGAKQRAINFDAEVVDRVFPMARDSDLIPILLRYTPDGDSVAERVQVLKRQAKNWRLTGQCITESWYRFVKPGCLFAMVVDSSRQPASGSWAVFPKNHDVTSRILAHAESSSLAKSSMIALHGPEGAHSRGVLAKYSPLLFSEDTYLPQNKKKSPTKTQQGSQILTPEPVRLWDMLASVGHTLPSAVADLVDNAISADATDIRVTLGAPDGGHGRWMSIIDNGKGMDRDGLANAMRIGSNRDYAEGELGKYGFGLKGASWSQCRKMTVVTSDDVRHRHHLSWDRGHLMKVGEWDALGTQLSDWERKATSFKGSGTAVLWSEMTAPHITPPSGVTPYAKEIADLEQHLALVFHRFIEGKAAGRRKVQIRINDVPVEPNNPVGHPKTKKYGRKDIRLPGVAGNPRAQVQAYVTPTEEEIRSYYAHQGQEEVAKQLQLISLGGRRNETQGLYVYRCDRLISWGGWADMMALEEKTKLVRVTVDFDQALDDALQVNISKRQVTLPMVLKEELKKIIKEPRAESRARYKTPSTTKVRREAGPVGPVPAQPRPGSSPAPDDGAPAPPLGQSAGTGQAVMARKVTTKAFLWQLKDGYAGKRVLEVNSGAKRLVALVDALKGDPAGVAALANFLRDVDDVGLDLQKAWLSKQVGPKA